MSKTGTHISILMPVFNAEPYLKECIESVIKQTENQWELIAVNDFSSDKSMETLKHFAAIDSRIKVFNNTSKGIIPALQLALGKSSGQFITRMDADDLMAEDKLALLKAVLLKHGNGHLATGLVEYFSDTTLGNGYQRYADWLNDLTQNGDNFEDIYRECVIPSPCWMVSRKDFLNCGAFNSNTYPEDYDLCFRFYEQGLKVLGINKILHYWRDHQTRASRNDPNYANINFFTLKLSYFLRLDYDEGRQLLLWGAGKKGKQLAKLLIDRGIPFKWVCNNPRKWGVKIYEQQLFPCELVFQCDDNQFIVSVSSPEEQQKIKKQFVENGCEKTEDYYFFC